MSPSPSRSIALAPPFAEAQPLCFALAELCVPEVPVVTSPLVPAVPELEVA